MTRQLASVGSRFSAHFIDGAAALAIAVAAFCVARQTGAPRELAVWSFIAYFLLCDALPDGRSIGKRFMGIAVIQVQSERPCSWWRAILRRFPLFLLGIVDVVFITGPARRRLGDYLAGTKVVNATRR